MIISFFEEFCTKENMNKYSLVDWKSNLYLGAKDVEHFKKLGFKNAYWWSILSKKEGYWLSPFSKRKALLNVMKYNGKIMWDAELPTSQNLLLYFTQFFNFNKNKRDIYNYFIKNGSNIVTAEYFPEKGILRYLMDSLGLTFDPKKYGNSVCKMMYSSMHNYSPEFVKEELKNGVKMYGSKFKVGLGVLDKGVGDEELINCKILDRDLALCSKYNVSEVIIYRLGGLNKEYLKVIKKYV